ncbi:porin family protein [Allomuricauda sp.]|uniref:porin family protein n=1 Tax=Flagellimonas sp. TaxID=2058762 RepID=UPI001B21DD4A|nr:porin family protein [Allomuricauda sp.]MBO6828559.1 PorT family protein [Allomuricauda sp.]
MKKVNLLIALLICLTASAQIDHNFGVKAGANYSHSRSDWSIYEGKIGYYVGGYFNLGLSDIVSLRPELLLVNQGSRVYRDLPNGFGFDTVENNVNDIFIQLPITFRFKVVSPLHIEIGPQMGYLIKRTEVFKEVPIDSSMEGERINYDASLFDQFDVALNGGFGFDITNKLEVNARYSWGLTELDNHYKTSVISLGLVLRI